MTDVLPELRVVEHENEWIVRSKFSFAYEPYDTPELSELRERYRHSPRRLVLFRLCVFRFLF